MTIEFTPEDTAPDFKIAVLGPTRVGKTVLISAILDRTERLLAGTGVSIRAVGEAEDRITQHIDELEAALHRGRFQNHSNGNGHFQAETRGTDTRTELFLEMAVNNHRLTWAILDYPGSWLNPSFRAHDPGTAEKWRRCEQWIKESSVLIVPIDASLVMEAKPDHYEAQRKALQLSATRRVARDWARARCAANEPGLLVFAPVKCETYFNDNLVKDRPDRKHELYASVTHDLLYGGLREHVVDEFKASNQLKNLRIEYHPIDTIGCVQLESSRWDPDLVTSYSVLGRNERTPVGVDYLMGSLCGHLLSREVQPGSLLEWVRNWLTGRASALGRAIRKFEQLPPGPRYRDLSP